MKISLKNLEKWVYPHFRPVFSTKKRIVILKGGRGSAKSFHLGLLTNLKSFTATGDIVVFQSTYNATLLGTYKNLGSKIDKLKMGSLFKAGKSPRSYYNKATGRYIYFRGVDDAEKLKSIEEFEVVWIEEANLISFENWQILEKSFRYHKGQIYISFNPVSPNHWLFEELINPALRGDRDDVFVHHSTYLDNKYIAESFKRSMEYLKEKNPRRYAIDGLGETGVLDGLIFDTVKIESFDKNAFKDRSRYGLDFGFNDPQVLTESAIVDGKLYIINEQYNTGVSDSAAWVKGVSWYDPRKQIVADSSRPETIKAMQSKNISIVGASKPGSLWEQLQFYKTLEFIVHPTCSETIKELYSYAWHVDKNGRCTDDPEDCNNHAIDSIRYAQETLFMRSKSGTTTLNLWG